jgi:hypothetical protein
MIRSIGVIISRIVGKLLYSFSNVKNTEIKNDKRYIFLKTRPFVLINIVLLCAIFILLITIIHEYFYRNEAKAELRGFERGDSSAAIYTDIKFKSLKDYLQTADKRDFFNIKAGVDIEKRSVAVNDSDRLNDIKRSLKLIGIMTGQVRTAIIKSPEYDESKYFKIGDKVLGVTIKDIEKSRVILTDSLNEIILTF